MVELTQPPMGLITAGVSGMAKLYRLDQRHLLFHCAGCRKAHLVRIEGPGPIWDWNQSLDAPTFSPSLIYNSQDQRQRCHCYVRDGEIEYLADSYHNLARQRLTLPDWPEDLQARQT